MNMIIRLIRRFNIRNRIAAFLLAELLIFSVVILLFSTFFSQFIIKKYMYGYIEVVQKEIVSSIEMVVDEAIMLTVRLKTNRDIYDLFDNKEISYNKRSKELRRVLEGLLVDNENIANVLIVSNAGEFYSYNENNPIFKIKDNLYVNQIDKFIKPVWGNLIMDVENKSYIPYGMKFCNFYTGQNIGYLIVYIREEALQKVYKDSVKEQGYSFVVSQSGCIISHPQKDIVGKILFDFDKYNEENSTFSYKTLEDSNNKIILATYRFGERLRLLGCDWEIVSSISYDRLFTIINKVNRYLLGLGIIMLLISVIISIYMSKRLNKPVKMLREKLNEFGKGNSAVFLEEKGGDEIQELENSFNDMVERINGLIENNNMEKEKQRELELIALQAQINPHFLYNTLDAIGWIAKLNKQQDIEQMVMALAKFFRLSLHKGDRVITVEEEIGLVQSFVKIEQLRSPDKFKISYNIPEEIKQLKILKIVLQPLVENAIKHGIGRKRGEGNITVNAFETSNGLKFQVIDDGAGFDVNNTNFNKQQGNIQHGGYGLRNVDERIKLEYGKEYGLVITSEIGKGTKAEIYLKISD